MCAVSIFRYSIFFMFFSQISFLLIFIVKDRLIMKEYIKEIGIQLGVYLIILGLAFLIAIPIQKCSDRNMEKKISNTIEKCMDQYFIDNQDSFQIYKQEK